MKAAYRRMLSLMQSKANSGPTQKRKETWFLYMLMCNDGSFYTGITKNLNRRIAQHNAGRASRYTRTRRPVLICYQETCAGRTDALVREIKIKSLPRKIKEQLAKQHTSPVPLKAWKTPAFVTHTQIGPAQAPGEAPDRKP